MVCVHWNNSNEEWYTSKGYVFTKRYDPLFVKAKDLSPQSNAKIYVTCDYCGKIYKASYCNVKRAIMKFPKISCANCHGTKGAEISLEKRKHKVLSKIKTICEENDYDLISDFSDFKDVSQSFSFSCKKHGIQTMMIQSFIYGHKCYYCGREENKNKKMFSKSHVLNYINNNGCKLLNPDDYIGISFRNLSIECSCGKIFTTSFQNFKDKKVRTCFSCSSKESVGEKRIREWLEKNKIIYEKEKRFKNCRDKRPLPFDFYLPEYNLIIEFDGIQHFKPIRGEKSYQITKEHDKIKNEYCVKNNIDLIRIKYDQFYKIDEILKKTINDISKRYSLVS